MDKRQQILEKAILSIQEICNKMIHKEPYMQALAACINEINEAVTMLLTENEENKHEILPLLEDMMYGMSQQDEVFLLDVLRFGLLPSLERYHQKKENPQLEGLYE